MIDPIIRHGTKVSSWILYFCLIAAFATSSVLAGEHEKSGLYDHLVPIDGLLEPAYQTLLSQKLFVTPANFTRIAILPSAASKGEVAVAIYSDPSKAEENAFITCTRAEKNLWYAASDENGVLSRDIPFQIARFDAPFPKAVATAVSKGVRRMLSQSQPEPQTNKVLVDGTDIEFSIDDPASGPVRGLLTPYARGNNGTALRRLTEMLEAYCEATPVNRKRLVKKIEAKAKQLAKYAPASSPKSAITP